MVVGRDIIVGVEKFLPLESSSSAKWKRCARLSSNFSWKLAALIYPKYKNPSTKPGWMWFELYIIVEKTHLKSDAIF